MGFTTIALRMTLNTPRDGFEFHFENERDVGTNNEFIGGLKF